MKWLVTGLLVLIACTQVQPEIAPAIIIIDEGCQATKSIGESCDESCDCLKPGKCLDGICSLVNLEDEQPCFANQQCISGTCTNNFCGAIDSKAVYECDRICKENYNGERDDCSTVCRSRA